MFEWVRIWVLTVVIGIPGVCNSVVFIQSRLGHDHQGGPWRALKLITHFRLNTCVNISQQIFYSA